MPTLHNGVPAPKQTPRPIAAPGQGSAALVATEPWKVLRWQSRHQAFVEKMDGTERLDGLDLTLMRIPAGGFLMGAPEGEEGREKSERPVHRVMLQDFLLGRTPITQAQWRLVASWQPLDGESTWEKALNPVPSRFDGDQRPVEQVSWDDAMEFCRRLGKRTGRNYTLPSGAQWEYACRAGTTTPFHFGSTISPALTNYNLEESYGDCPKGAPRKETCDVGNYPANPWGLHDMHGNVWEWCMDDWYPSYDTVRRQAPKDGGAWIDTEASNSALKSLRSGSWGRGPRLCRSAYRDSGRPGNLHDVYVFRVCCFS